MRLCGEAGSWKFSHGMFGEDRPGTVDFLPPWRAPRWFAVAVLVYQCRQSIPGANPTGEGPPGVPSRIRRRFKGLVINPSKCKAMCSSTLAMHATGLLKPTFSVDGVDIEYVESNRYLGFAISNSLATATHMQQILSKLRKTIAIFGASVNIRKRALLLRFARTYIMPTMHNLEFVPRITKSNIQRFNFLMTRFLKLRSVDKLHDLQRNYKWLKLETLHSDARRRYTHDF